MLENKRYIDLEGTFNFRDLGGFIGDGGKTVKWGTFFRADSLANLTPADVKKLVSIGLKTIVDFRGESEWQKEPDKDIPGAKIVNLSPNAKVAKLASGNITEDKEKIEKLLETAHSPQGAEYFEKRLNEMSDQMRELVSGDYAIGQYQKFMQLILQEENIPVLFHCRGGKDRTGWGAMLILITLGVDMEQIKEDYLATKEYMKARNVKRMDEYRKYTDNEMVLTYLAGLMDTRVQYFEAAVDEIHKMSTSPEQYLYDVLKMKDADIAKMRKLYLE